MINFDFKRTSRKCDVSGRVFASGEEYVSVLIDNDGELIRKDVSNEKWDKPPENCVGWWKSRVPNLEKGNVYWAPRDVLLSYFQHMTEQHSNSDIAYVIAILLLQKKYLRLLDTISENDIEVMRLVCNSTKERFEVPVASISDDRIQEIQDELAEKLFTDVAPTEE